MSLTVSHRIGDIDVTILTDGARSFEAALFPNADAAHVEALLARAGEAEIRTNCNAALLDDGRRKVLVDTGPRDLFGPTAGNLPAALNEAGVDPEEIDVLFVTHLHPDHIAGAVDAEGNAVFPNAELVVMEDDRAFWADASNFA